MGIDRREFPSPFGRLDDGWVSEARHDRENPADSIASEVAAVSGRFLLTRTLGRGLLQLASYQRSVTQYRLTAALLLGLFTFVPAY